MGYQEGDTVRNLATGHSSTLQRGPDGMLKWSDPVPIPGASPSGKVPPQPQQQITTPLGEDLAKTAAPALERAVVGGATAIPTLASGAAQYLGEKGSKYLPESIGGPIQRGAEATSNFLKPATYPQVQGKIESSYNQAHPNAPLYYPQTGLGQLEEAAIGGGVAAVGGPLSMARALTGPMAKMGGRLATGVGAGVGSEAAGQLADAADLGPEVSEGSRLLGAVVGGREAAERPRKLVTPYPAISPAHTDMAALLAKQPGDITTAGQATGNPRLLQKEGNLAPHAPAPYNNLGVTQPNADTSSLGASMGLNPAQVGKTGLSSSVIRKGKDTLGDQRDILEANTQSRFDPEFHQKLQDIQSDYYRAKNRSPNPVTPSPIDKRIQDIYQNLPTSSKPTRMGLTGQNFSQLTKDLNAEIGGYVKGKNADPLVVKGLSQLRDALTDNMERSQAGTPYAGKWTENNSQLESAEALKKAVKAVPPAAGIMDPNVVSAHAQNPDSQIAQLARAQATVHKPLPAPAAPSGTIPAMAGALISHLTGGSPMEGSIAGHISGPDVTSSLLRNPVTAGLHFSPWNQARVRNQAWQPGPGSTMDPATVARLLALSKTERSTPQEQ